MNTYVTYGHLRRQGHIVRRTPTLSLQPIPSNPNNNQYSLPMVNPKLGKRYEQTTSTTTTTSTDSTNNNSPTVRCRNWFVKDFSTKVEDYQSLLTVPREEGHGSMNASLAGMKDTYMNDEIQPLVRSYKLRGVGQQEVRPSLQIFPVRKLIGILISLF